MYNAKNYTEQGGDKTVIGGTLEIKSGATITGLTGASLPSSTAAVKGAAKSAANQATSTASELAGLVTDFNALLTKLKAAGLMVAD